MTKNEHTPTPWVAGPHFAERHGGRTYIPVLRPGNDPVPLVVVHRDVDGYGRDEGEANAAFIVKAVNNHSDLVAALNFALNELDYIIGRHGYVSTETAAVRVRKALAEVSA